MTVQVKETAREIFYRLDSDPELKSTGFTEHVDLKTQAARPITLLSLPASTSACQVEVAYTDVRGVRRGPFTIAFNPEDQLLIDAKRELGYRQQSWMMFGNGRHRDQLYFNFLARYRDVIRTVRFAVDHHLCTARLVMIKLYKSCVAILLFQIGPVLREDVSVEIYLQFRIRN